jgi:hypothetical protein
MHFPNSAKPVESIAPSFDSTFALHSPFLVGQRRRLKTLAGKLLVLTLTRNDIISAFKEKYGNNFYH